MNHHDVSAAIDELRREKWTYAKREETRREVDAVMRRVDGLETALGAARAEIDSLRTRCEQLENDERNRAWVNNAETEEKAIRPHIHVSQGIKGNDSCKLCGNDLRHPIHLSWQETTGRQGDEHVS
jgi:hypothetical protein